MSLKRMLFSYLTQIHAKKKKPGVERKNILNVQFNSLKESGICR